MTTRIPATPDIGVLRQERRREQIEALKRFWKGIRNIGIAGGILAILLWTQNQAYRDEVEKELQVVESCNDRGLPAYRNDQGRMVCGKAAPPWSFPHPLKTPEGAR